MKYKNYYNIHALFLIIVLFFIAESLYPQENNDVISIIEIIGLKKTKPHIAKKPLEKFIGMEKSSFDQNEVFAVIMDSGIMEPVSAELIENEEGLILCVTVREKWTLIPIPIIFAGKGGFNFGLFLLESNAFGLRDMAVLGGMYGSLGWNVMAMYNHTPGSNNLPGFNIFFMYGHQEKEAADRNENIHRRYSTERLRSSIGINYLFIDLITGSFSVSYTNINLKNTKNAFNPPVEGVAILGFNTGLSLRKSDWDGFLLSQQSISLGYNFNYAVSGYSFHQLEYRGVFEQSLIPGFRLIIRSGGVWKSLEGNSSSTAILFEEGPQNSQVAILPRNFSALHYAGFSAGLEKYIFKWRWGTLSVQGSWQGVFSYGPISGFKFDHGPAAGLHFYLSRLALPAFGGIFAYNINTRLFQFSFSMGMSF